MPTIEGHYVDNEKLLEELTIYVNAVAEAKEKGEPKPRVSEYIGECILLVSKKLCNRPNFINYPFREEMIGDGIENCLMYIHNFNPNASKNPFGYITQIIYWAFVRRITKEKTHLYTKHKVLQRSMIFDELSTSNEWDDDTAQAYFENEHMNEFVENFEKTVLKKKQKKRKNNLNVLIEDDA